VEHALTGLLPERLPGQHFRVANQQPQQGNQVPIARPICAG
jgi:hypothetical protein